MTIQQGVMLGSEVTDEDGRKYFVRALIDLRPPRDFLLAMPDGLYFMLEPVSQQSAISQPITPRDRNDI